MVDNPPGTRPCLQSPIASAGVLPKPFSPASPLCSIVLSRGLKRYKVVRNCDKLGALRMMAKWQISRGIRERAWGESNTRPAALKAAGPPSYLTENKRLTGSLLQDVLRIVHTDGNRGFFIFEVPNAAMRALASLWGTVAASNIRSAALQPGQTRDRPLVWCSLYGQDLEPCKSPDSAACYLQPGQYGGPGDVGLHELLLVSCRGKRIILNKRCSYSARKGVREERAAERQR
jgi:hypothetical protein